jgi:hypothetical protein
MDLARLADANTFLVDRDPPHIVKFISPSLEEVIRESEVVVIGSDNSAIRNLPELLLNDQILIDLAGVTRDVTARAPKVPVSLNEGNDS